jgi:type IX secretion system PorP/SprF family membrane protein
MGRYYKWFVMCMAFQYTFPASSQDVAFSQFYDQPLLRNPALAGVFTGDVRFEASYRNQWQSVTVPYQTFGLSSEIKLPVNIRPDDNVTIGLQLIKDVAGTSEFSTTQMLPAVNYSFSMGGEKNSYLSLAFMGGLIQQRFDPTKLVLNDQFVSGSNGSFTILPTSRQVFDNTNINYFDFSTGLSYNGVIRDNIDFFAGAALFHVFKPQVAFFQGKEVALNKKYTLNFGMSVPASEDDQFILYGDYFMQGGINTFQAGMLYSHDLFVLDDDHKTITGGILYRWDDAVIPVIQLELNKFIIGTSYDVNISKLAIASQYRGGFELSLTYRAFLNNRKSEERQTRCPRFGGHLPGGHFLSN